MALISSVIPAIISIIVIILVILVLVLNHLRVETASNSTARPAPNQVEQDNESNEPGHDQKTKQNFHLRFPLSLQSYANLSFQVKRFPATLSTYIAHHKERCWKSISPIRVIFLLMLEKVDYTGINISIFSFTYAVEAYPAMLQLIFQFPAAKPGTNFAGERL